MATKTKATAPLRALTKLSLRKSPDRKSPLWDEGFVWEKGVTFAPPPHMMVDRAIDRGIAELEEVALKRKPKTKVKEVTHG